LRKTDASKLPEERFFQVVGIEICSPSAPGIRRKIRVEPTINNNISTAYI
jgi:hypothetical protein